MCSADVGVPWRFGRHFGVLRVRFTAFSLVYRIAVPDLVSKN